MADDNGNGSQRVTNAVLKRDIEYLTVEIQDWRDEQRRCNQDHEDRIRALEKTTNALRERVGIWAGVQGFISLVLSGISAWIGSKT